VDGIRSPDCIAGDHGTKSLSSRYLPLPEKEIQLRHLADALQPVVSSLAQRNQWRQLVERAMHLQRPHLLIQLLPVLVISPSLPTGIRNHRHPFEKLFGSTIITEEISGDDWART
jgi:hypothetical protein